MDKSYLIQILKDRYEYEQFRRNNFDNVINLPITVLALLIGGLFAFAFQTKAPSEIFKVGVSFVSVRLATSQTSAKAFIDFQLLEILPCLNSPGLNY